MNFGAVGFLGATQLWSADFAIGKWHQRGGFIVHWSTNPKLGSVDVWYDGKEVVTAYTFQTKPDQNTLFYQNGLHRKVQENFVDTIYIDDFIEADTFAEAQIAAPSDSGSDGGTTAAEGGATDGAGADASVSTADAGTSGATAGASEDDDSGNEATASTAGSGAASGAGSQGGTGASGSDVSTSGTASGVSTSSGSASDHVDSASKSGCAVSGRRARPAPLAAVLAILGLALARRRRAGQGATRKR